MNFEQIFEGMERVNQAGAEWGCSRQKAKALKRIVRQGSGQGASVAGVQLKSEVSFIAIHNILGMVRIPVSTDCSKQPLQGFEWSLYTV